MVQGQTTIFDFLYPKYKIKKPIRLIELFAGYGSQYLALKYLGANVEHYKICEWAVKNIQAYNDLHIQNYCDYSKCLCDKLVLDALMIYGVSINYNEPATREQLKKQDFRNIYNNIIATNNLVNIQRAKGKDFKIVDKNQYDYIMTYSFPCQDLSLAGKGKGMADTSTRSGMLWEAERILNELETLSQLPQVLLMENVPQVHGMDNIKYFNKWQLALEKLGYKNYFQDLIATDYGIPQTRNRCFMISVLGNYSYTFPKPMPLKLKLNDLLEKNVNEKFYLSDKQIKCLSSDKVYKNGYIRGNQFKKNINPDVCTTITASSSDRASDTFISIQTTSKEGVCYNDLKIRKLTPLECFRLMGVKDKDYYKIAKNQSNSSLYHLAGDSIVVDVLMAIFKEMIEQK